MIVQLVHGEAPVRCPRSTRKYTQGSLEYSLAGICSYKAGEKSMTMMTYNQLIHRYWSLSNANLCRPFRSCCECISESCWRFSASLFVDLRAGKNTVVAHQEDHVSESGHMGSLCRFGLRMVNLGQQTFNS